MDTSASICKGISKRAIAFSKCAISESALLELEAKAY